MSAEDEAADWLEAEYDESSNDTVILTGDQFREMLKDTWGWKEIACRAMEFEQESDGRWIAEVPSLPGFIAYGETKEEAAGKLHQISLLFFPEPK